jgi:hypothetical protein
MTKDELVKEITEYINSEAFTSVDADGSVDLGAASSEVEDFIDGLSDEDESDDEGDEEEEVDA